jgi:hypothetical protein
MKLVPANHLSREDEEIRAFLTTYPEAAYVLTRLINGYRELLTLCMDDMSEAHLDTADITIAMSKKDTALSCMGMPCFNSAHDWYDFYDKDRQRRQYEEKEEKEDETNDHQS